MICDQKGIEFDQKVGVLLDLSHGVSVKIVGSTNYFAMYSVSCSKIMIFGVKIVTDGSNCGDDDDSVVVKLIRCGVIECCKPVWSIGIFSGLLILGEDNGVRIINLRDIVKGKLKKRKKGGGRVEEKRLRNGQIEGKKKENPVHGKSIELVTSGVFIYYVNLSCIYIMAIERNCRFRDLVQCA